MASQKLDFLSCHKIYLLWEIPLKSLKSLLAGKESRRRQLLLYGILLNSRHEYCPSADKKHCYWMLLCLQEIFELFDVCKVLNTSFCKSVNVVAHFSLLMRILYLFRCHTNIEC